MSDYILIVYSPDSQGPGTQPVDVYGPSDQETLTGTGHLLCDGSSGWVFIVIPKVVWKTLSAQPLQKPEWGSV